MKEQIKLRPMAKRVIVETEEINPHRKAKTESGIIIPDNRLILNGMDKEANGIVEDAKQRIMYGVIQAVADDCVLGLKEGDQVVIDSFAGMPVAMGIPNLIIIPEGAVQYVIDVTNE